MLCASTVWSRPWNLNPNLSFTRTSDLVWPPARTRFFSPLSTFPLHISLPKNNAPSSSSSSSVFGSAGYTEEPATKVKFQTYLNFPGFSNSLTLLGTGYREKVFAIIGVKVYAAGLYINPSILGTLDAWKGQSAVEIQGNSALFNLVLQAPYEKSLQIALVREVEGKTFWDALDDAISPRIKVPTLADESALTTFRSIFQGRSLQKGTFICLTWLDHSKMLVSISSAQTPDCVDARIESANVTFALFDTFFGGDPVSPSLKGSVANGLATMLRRISSKMHEYQLMVSKLWYHDKCNMFVLPHSILGHSNPQLGHLLL